MEQPAINRMNERRAEELAERIRDLNQEAFREFVIWFAPVIARYLRKQGLPESDADAQSLVIAEKAALQIRAGKYQFKREGGVIAWVFSIARMEKRGWYRRNISATSTEDLENSAEKENSAEPLALPNETVQAVQEAVARLSPDDQRIIELRILDSTLSYKEIGHLLGIQNGAARIRYFRAIERLKRFLELDERLRHILQRKPHRQMEEVKQ